MIFLWWNSKWLTGGMAYRCSHPCTDYIQTCLQDQHTANATNAVAFGDVRPGISGWPCSHTHFLLLITWDRGRRDTCCPTVWDRLDGLHSHSPPITWSVGRRGMDGHMAQANANLQWLCPWPGSTMAAGAEPVVVLPLAWHWCRALRGNELALPLSFSMGTASGTYLKTYQRWFLSVKICRNNPVQLGSPWVLLALARSLFHYSLHFLGFRNMYSLKLRGQLPSKPMGKVIWYPFFTLTLSLI